MNRRESAGETDGAATYEAYFTAAADFLAQDDMALPREVAGRAMGTPPESVALDAVCIHLVKHGAFYHPAQVSIGANGQTITLALNVAVSDAGRRRLAHEAAHLTLLHDTFPDHYVPGLYGAGAGRAGDGREIPMFAAEWLTGFYELHQTPTASGAGRQWSVWDCDHGTWLMTDDESDSFFRQAARILSYYFDPHTLSTIQSWHHAAGDFVVGKTGAGIQVRLITVRRYGPVMDLGGEAVDLQTLLEALTVHLLRTSLWMRIDRFDGVGELVWAHDRCLAPICRGYLQGVARMARLNGLPDEFVLGVTQYLAVHPPEAFQDMGLQLLSQLPETMPEAALIREHLDTHCTDLTALLSQGAA